MKDKNRFTLAGLLLLVACGSKESINEVQYGITTAATVAYAASISMEAVKSGSSVCATVKTGCTTYSCNGAVTVNLGAACPLPLGGVASGIVEVTGAWSSVDS